MALTPKQNLLRVIGHDNPEWVPNGLESVVMLYPPYVERPLLAGYDSFGVKWDFAAEGTYPAHNGHTITDIHQRHRQITIPDVNAMDWNEITLGWERKPLHLDHIDREEHLICGIVELGLFERSYLLLGMENALIAYITEPDLMEEMIAAIADFKIAVIKRFHEVANLEMVWFGDDWGTQNNLFMAPEVWRRIIKPHIKRIYSCMKERAILINQHSCGKIESVFGDIVEMGADIWNPCQPCNNLAGLKSRYGKQITFCGGIDSQFVLDRPGVSPDEVRAEVRKRIDEMAVGGGYVAEPSHSVSYGPKVLSAMNDEIAVYGRSYYRRQARS